MTRKTVFVIGAGASKEANLPTGFELKAIISKLLDMRFDWHKQTSGSPTIYEALKIITKGSHANSGDIDSYMQEAHHIRDALQLALSIDNFIDQHRDNQKIAICGKLAIVESILEAERKSLLYIKQDGTDSTINFNGLEKTWYLNFFRLLTENCQKNELAKRFKSITLIIFNYDRCVEFFMFRALQKVYQINGNEAAELLECLSIYHPYGSVGSLPYLEVNDTISFGQTPNGQQLLTLAQQIKTFTEGTDPNSSHIKEIQDRMTEASHLVFLGFAFHKLNMSLITPSNTLDVINRSIKCFASTMGLSLSDQKVIKEQIFNLYNSQYIELKVNQMDIELASLECNKFLTEYWKSIAF